MPSSLPSAERVRGLAAARLEPEVCRARPLLGTLVQIRAAASCSRIQLHQAIDSAFTVVEAVQQLMSYHDPRSDLSRINRDAAASVQKVSVHTYTVLEAALRFAQLSDGAFDPCVGTQLERWGYLPRARRGAQAKPSQPATWRDVDLLGHGRVRLRRPLRLDLGGIAKGYAVDQAVVQLQGAGVERILVNAGGDLRIAGDWSQSLRWRHPLAPQLTTGGPSLRDAALATSAAYYSRRRTTCGEVSALLDPRNAKPYVGDDSVSVRAADCMSADALTKVVLFASPQSAERALASCDAQAFVQTVHAGISLDRPRHRPAKGFDGDACAAGQA